MPTIASQIIIALIPVIGIIMGSILLFFSILWAHREKMSMISRGIYVPVRFELALFSLLLGLLLSGVGLVLTIVFALLDGFSYPIVGGLVPMVMGFCLLLFYRIIPKENHQT